MKTKVNDFDKYEYRIWNCMPRTEVGLRGKKRVYDACSSYSFLKAMTRYNFFTFKFIGSSYIYYINGVQNKSDRRHYFFVYRKRYLYLRKKANL